LYPLGAVYAIVVAQKLAVELAVFQKFIVAK